MIRIAKAVCVAVLAFGAYAFRITSRKKDRHMKRTLGQKQPRQPGGRAQDPIAEASRWTSSNASLAETWSLTATRMLTRKTFEIRSGVSRGEVLLPFCEGFLVENCNYCIDIGCNCYVYANRQEQSPFVQCISNTSSWSWSSSPPSSCNTYETGSWGPTYCSLAAGYTLISDELTKIQEVRTLGAGAFGEVVLGRLGTQSLAIKKESREAEVRLLQSESEILLALQGVNAPSIPKIYTVMRTPTHLQMVYELFDTDLATYRKAGSPVTLEAVTELARQLFAVLEYLHRKHVIHCDIKPANLMIRYDGGSRDLERASLYLIDFGMSAKIFTQPQGRGSPSFMSINALKQGILGYRDDVMSALYSLVWFFTGELPWPVDEVTLESGQTRKEAMLKKRQQVDFATSGLIRSLPPEFKDAVRSVAAKCDELRSPKDKPAYKEFQQSFTNSFSIR